MIEAFQRANRQAVICVTGDHTTPVKYGDHTYEPVPILAAAAIANDQINSSEFSEEACAKGELGRFRGCEILDVLQGMRSQL